MTTKDLEKKFKTLGLNEEELSEKYRANFEKYATYMGGGTYQWKGIFESDVRRLWLKGLMALSGHPIHD